MSVPIIFPISSGPPKAYRDSLYNGSSYRKALPILTVPHTQSGLSPCLLGLTTASPDSVWLSLQQNRGNIHCRSRGRRFKEDLALRSMEQVSDELS